LPRPQPFRCYPALVFLCPLPLHFLFISLSFALSFHYHSSCCFLIILSPLSSLSPAPLSFALPRPFSFALPRCLSLSPSFPHCSPTPLSLLRRPFPPFSLSLPSCFL